VTRFLLLSIAIVALSPIGARAACTGASPAWSATCSQADVQSCINNAADGDTITVLSGSCNWSSTVSISGKGLRLTGQSPGSVTIVNNVSGSALSVSKDATHSTEIANLRFVRGTGNSMHLYVSGSGKPPLIHDNYFDMRDVSPNHPIRLQSNGGVFWSNQFIAGTVKPNGCGSPSNYGDYHDLGCIQVNPDSQGNALWSAPHTIGAADTTGTANTYFEDNVFEGCLQQSVDGSNGAKVVFRHNTLNDSAVVMHGADTDQYGGARHWEFYNNTFSRVYGGAPINRWFYLRGATGVILDNQIANPNSTCYGNKDSVEMTIQYLRRSAGLYGCWNSGYPAPHQVGQIADARDTTPDFPIAISGNTGAGASMISTGDYSPNQCGASAPSTASYVQAGRDYITTSPSGYVKYTYPHPLRTGTSTPPTNSTLQAPSNLRVLQ
jgi:hypothetical protein